MSILMIYYSFIVVSRCYAV